MIAARAVVVRVEGGHAWVRLDERAGGCGRCDEPGGCRSAKLSHAFGSPQETFRLSNQAGARPGDAVRLQIAEGAPLRAALATYGLTAMLTVLGAGIGAGATAGGDAGALIGAGAGLGVALAVNRLLLQSRGWRGGLNMELALDEGGCARQHEKGSNEGVA